MEELTIRELKEELDRWPELDDYKIKVGPYQLVKDKYGNIFEEIKGKIHLVSLQRKQE